MRDQNAKDSCERVNEQKMYFFYSSGASQVLCTCDIGAPRKRNLLREEDNLMIKHMSSSFVYSFLLSGARLIKDASCNIK